MRVLLIIIITVVLCVSCGVKDDPKYKSLNNYYKAINLV